ncbi:MAG: hypothetical protein LC792_18345 [Actinobacteria bacterium]|nr:hypothetical protein [Actinomycetota bacterium]
MIEVIERMPLQTSGKSGARLERVTTADGRILIVKFVDPEDDWVVRATGDDGRLFRLWSAGMFGRLPAGVDSVIETVEELPRGWVVVMRDVTQSLVPAGRLLTRQESRRAVAAASSVHDAFAGIAIDGLCPLVDRLSFLAPAVARATTGNPIREFILDGWTRFFDLVPEDVGQAMAKLMDRPGRLAAELAGHPATLLHGDLRMANMGFDGSTVILLDWGSLTGLGPAAVDHAWYVAVNSAAVDAGLDDLLFDAREALRPEDRPALPLALLGALLQLGWDKALGATSDDPAIRDRERAGLAWWWARARDALEQWSPA